MDIQTFYEMTGGNYAEALSRLGNDARITKFANMFTRDDSMENLRAAVAAQDIEASFRAVHTLKGVAGNLSFTKLYDDACALTEQLRPLEAQADPALLAQVESTYSTIIEGLENLQ